MSYAIKIDGIWSEIAGSFVATTIVNDEPDAVQFPANWPDLVSAEERATIGVVEIVEPGPQPLDVRVTGTAIEDVAGAPTRVWVTQPHDLDALAAELLAELDAGAEATRLQFITPGAGQGMTYQYKSAEAAAWVADNTVPVPFLAAEAQARGMTVPQLVEEVRANAAAWTAIGSRIEAARMGAKTAVRSATSASAMISAAKVDWAGLVA